MPRLDVSRVLRSREFRELDPLICTRNTQTVGDDGIARNVGADTTFSGVVTSDQGDVLSRLPESSYVLGTITIHSQFPLLDGRTGTDADIVTWKERRYTVTNVNDYSTWGAGFTAATCVPLALSGT
jgi:galactose-6-phosphate isomerase